jgi:virulence factor Mce-like protein
MSEFGGKKASIGLGLAVALAISAVATMVGIFSLGSGNNDYTVKVQFPTANGLIDGSDVFIAGVKVGTVSSVTVDNKPPLDNSNSSFANPTQSAKATLTIGKHYAPLHEGATAAIRPKSLLGEKYVAMTVGDPGKNAIPDGTTLPPSAISVNVELDQLINTFDEATRQQLQKLINNLGTGLAGQGRNTNETIQVGRQDLGNLGQVTDVLAARDAELKRLIDALTKITQTLGSDQQTANYPDLLTHSQAVLKTLIAEDADVAQGTDRLNQFFAILDAGFAGRQQDFQAVLAALPRTISDLDALASTLGPQGHVALGIARSAAPGVVAGDLVFGATPANHTWTNDLWVRAMPSQGCSVVNTRYNDANGARDAPPTTRPGPNINTQLCTTPLLKAPPPCAAYNPLGGPYTLQCGVPLTGALCVNFGYNANYQGPLSNLQRGYLPYGCPVGRLGTPSTPATTPTNVQPQGIQPQTIQPERGVLGVPLQLPPANNQAADALLGYLLR